MDAAARVPRASRGRIPWRQSARHVPFAPTAPHLTYRCLRTRNNRIFIKRAERRSTILTRNVTEGDLQPCQFRTSFSAPARTKPGGWRSSEGPIGAGQTNICGTTFGMVPQTRATRGDMGLGNPYRRLPGRRPGEYRPVGRFPMGGTQIKKGHVAPFRFVYICLFLLVGARGFEPPTT